MMEIPAILYGLWRSVKPQVKRSVDKIIRGASWHEAMLRSGMANTEDLPGFIVLDGPSSLVGGAPHFHMFAPWALLRDNHLGEIDPKRLEELFEASLQEPWGVMTLLSHGGQRMLWADRHRYLPLLRMAVHYWPLFESLGPRYTVGSNYGEPLWNVPNSTGYILANLGVSNEVLNEPLPPGGLAELARPFLQTH